METILIILMFTIPGLMVRNIEKRIFTKSKVKETDYINQYNFFIDSVFIYLIGLLIFEIIIRTSIGYKLLNLVHFEIHGGLIKNEDLSLFIAYFLWTLVICYPYTIIKKNIKTKFFLLVSKKYREKMNLSGETEFASVWDEVFENPNFSLTNKIILIEKDGELITQGWLKRYSPPHLEKREFLLDETHQIKIYLENDKKLPQDRKLLNDIDLEYYDSNNGLLVKIIDSTKLINYLNSCSE